jgi:hypothetical protein
VAVKNWAAVKAVARNRQGEQEAERNSAAVKAEHSVERPLEAAKWAA